MKHWRLVSLISLIAVILSACGNANQSTLNPQGEVAKMQYDLMVLSTLIMVFVVAVVTVLFLYVIVKFRYRKGQENIIPKQVEGSHTLELLWTIIPVILLIVLAVPTVSQTFKLSDEKQMAKDEKKKDAIVINVNAHLFWWEFEYPNQKVVTSQDMIIPVGKKVILNLKGQDIKHSFWVPALAGKIDTNVEGENKMWLSADKEGTYNGFCAEFCGPSHSLMQFKVKAVSEADYDTWLADMKNQKGQAVTAEAQEGEKIFKQSCIGCHAADANDTRPPAARLAPNLANFGDRDMVAGIAENNEANLKKWLKDPEAMKPGNLMTGKYGDLSSDEIDALTAYLTSLKIAK
ncbi:cytochrome c oxidase subunit II [Bacillus sp. AFS041924]|uniref:cytochrome c oxidase subunit II n=1 Tax=Bacillus sp. AFS041924 TaxID=2033503 RepID=UPI000BFDCDAD|nr:cytochrome c oxidase subunit II [Bacillus sp. AFS041924]PGS53055.1 cytochrome c oxidase subunit II [Bacillus sp. AFS041924]